MRDLLQNEIDEVSGGTLLSGLGSTIIGVTNAINAAFDTPLGAAVGRTLSDFGLGPLHGLADLGTFLASSAAYAVGSALGGTGTQTLHFIDDLSSGQYNISFGKYPIFSGTQTVTG